MTVLFYTKISQTKDRVIHTKTLLTWYYLMQRYTYSLKKTNKITLFPLFFAKLLGNPK